MKRRSEAPIAPLSRRRLLAAMAGAALIPAPLSAAAAPGLRGRLEQAAKAGDAAARLAALRSGGGRGLDRSETAIWRMVVRGLERELALQRAFPFGKSDGSSPYVVSHRHGAWLDLGKAEPSALVGRLDEESDRLRADAARGIAPPRFMIDPVLAAERRQASAFPAELRAAVTRQIAALEALPQQAAPGVWRLPGGAEYYALRLACTSGSDLSPEALDRRVRAESAALLARADRLLRGLGLTRASVGARLRALKRRQADLYTNDSAGRIRAVADMNAALDRLRPHLATWFNPPLELGSSVKRLSPADEAAGKRGYRDPPAEGRPGIYYPDLSSPLDRPRWTLVTVAHHETIPGHMLQMRRQAIADPLPLQVRYAAGYSEGWAIYAESLVDRIGLLSPVEQIGFIQSVLFRLARVTADIGIHLHRWDRARALRYLQETVGFELFFPFDVEVDRYCAEPGGFAGDALSAITLRRIAAARMRRGPRAMRAWHDAVLNSGPLNVEVLREI